MSSFRFPLLSRKTLWIPLGVVFFLVFALISVPATWGAYLLTRSSGLALTGVTGTLWQGRASLASVRTPEREYSLGQLSWQLQPWSLLTLAACAKVSTQLPQQQFDGEVCAASKGAVRLRNADVSLPSALVQTLFPVPVQGQFSAHIDNLLLRGDVLLALKGSASWHSARVNTGNSWLDLGSYAAQLSDNGNNGIKAQVFQLAGPMEVELAVEFLAPSGGSVKGELAAPRAFFESANALDMLAMFAQEDRVDDAGKTHYLVDLNL